MNNSDMGWWFALISLYNTTLGLSNIEKNANQQINQERIEKKIDKILEILQNEQ